MGPLDEEVMLAASACGSGLSTILAEQKLRRGRLKTGHSFSWAGQIKLAH
jgi:hypothetical protein